MNVDCTHSQLELRECIARRFGPEGDLRSMTMSARWNEYALARLLGMAFGVRNGGLGGGAVETMIFMEEVGKAHINDAYVPAVVQLGEILRACEAHPVAARMIEQLISGHAQLSVVADYGCVGLTAIVATSRNGKWLLNGDVRLVAGAVGATYPLVSAATTAGTAPLLMIVDADAPGVVVDPAPARDGQILAHVSLQDVAVAHSHTLMEGQEAASALRRSWDHATAPRCAEAVGAIAAGFDLTVEYVRTHRQFNTSLSSFQLVRHQLADMMMSLDLARSASMAAACACQYGPRIQREIAVSQAKVQINKVARSLPQTAVQPHGAVDWPQEYALDTLFKTLTVITQLHGDDRFHLRRLAAHADQQKEGVPAGG